MIYFVIRKNENNDPIAMVRLNSTESSDMTIGVPIPHPRFGWMAPVQRVGRHVFNLMIGDHDDIAEALAMSVSYRLEEVTKGEWESFVAFNLFPVLKLAVAK